MHLYVFIYNAFFPNIFLQSQYFFAVPLHLLNDTLNQNYHSPQPLNHQAAPITTVQTHTAIHLFIAMLPCSKELLQNTWLGKNHSRNEWLIRDWSPERAQKRCSYLGFSLERCYLARSKSASVPRVTSPFNKQQDVLNRTHPLRDPGESSVTDEAVIIHLIWHLH